MSGVCTVSSLPYLERIPLADKMGVHFPDLKLDWFEQDLEVKVLMFCSPAALFLVLFDFFFYLDVGSNRVWNEGRGPDKTPESQAKGRMAGKGCHG